MKNHRIPVLLSACAVTLITGCATTIGGVALDQHNTRIEPLYRVQQPAGTAAGQYAVGRLDLSEGRIDAAISRFRNALKLDPNFLEAYNGLGVAYGQSGRFEQAVEAFRSALACGPASAHVLSNLGFAQWKAGKLDDAWQSLGRSLELDPMNTRTRENIRLLARVHRIDRASALADAATAMPAVAQPASPATQAQTASSDPVIVQRVRAPDVQIAASAMLPGDSQFDVAAHSDQPGSGFAAPAAAVVAGAQAVAALVLDESARASAYQIVLSKSSDATFVQLSPGVYELRPATGGEEPNAALAFVAPPASAPASPAPDLRSIASRPAAARASLAALDGFEVSNGVGIRQLAGRTARQLARLGADVDRVSDYRAFDRTRTEIHYRSGFLDGAKAVQKRLPVEAKLVRSRRLHPDVNVRLVVGRDMVGNLAWWDQGDDAAPVAGAGTPAPAATAIAIARGPDQRRVAATIVRAEVDEGWRHL